MVVVRPFWRRASRTSFKRQHDCYIFTGCQHADSVGRVVILETPEEWQMMEDVWGRFAAEQFAAITARWPEEQRARFRRELDSKHDLPGAEPVLNLTADGDQNETHEQETQDNGQENY